MEISERLARSTRQRFKAYLQSSKVNYTVNVRMRLEDLVEVLLLPDVNIIELRSLATDELDPIDCFFGGIEQIVYNDDFVISLEEGYHGERSNVAAAPDENQYKHNTARNGCTQSRAPSQRP